MPKNVEHMGTNACSACARSKRKCGRQTPSCLRCVRRGMTCFYPSPGGQDVSRAPSLRPLVPHVSNAPLETETGTLLAEITADDLNSLGMDLTFPFLDNNLDMLNPSSEPQLLGTPGNKANWFLAPNSWSIYHDIDPAIASQVPQSKAKMKDYIKTLQCWFERWASMGTNPFIHHQLYKGSFPACVQIAYATLVSYVHRTPATTEAVLQIVQDRSSDLVQENQTEPVNEPIDLYAQLARLHALLVYQIIGLHDGDIRARHVAEGHLLTQDTWTHKLLNSASRTLREHSDALKQLQNHTSPSRQQWHLWILSESIRRTWLIAMSISSIFLGLQQRWATCPGGIMFTNRSGLWDARSATEWERRCEQGNVAFLQRFHCARLFGEMRPEDVDEFGLTMIEMTFDAELVEKWTMGSGGGYV